MKLSSSATKDALFVVLLLTVAATVLGFSNNLIRGYVSLRAAFLYFGAALLGWGLVLSALARDETFLGEKPLLAALGLEAVALAVSVAVSSMPWVSFLGSMPRLMGALSYWSFVVLGLGVVLTVSDSEAKLLALLRVLMIIALVVSVHSLHELVGTRGFRAPGLLGNPDFLGNWLAAVFFTGFALALYDDSRAGTVLAMLGSVMALVGIVFAQTRGAWLGMAVGMVVFLALARPGGQRADRTLRRTAAWFGLLFVVSLLLLVAFRLDWAKEGVLGYLHKVKANLPPDVRSASDAVYLAKFHGTVKTLAFLSIVGGLPLMGWALLVSLWLYWPARLKLGVLGGFLAALVVGLSLLWVTPTGRHLRKKRLRLHFENEGRAIIWRDTAKNMIPKVWYRGVGIETFRVGFLPYKSIDLAKNGPRQNWRNPHDVILYELASNGILGLLAFLSVVVVAFWLLTKARKRARGDPFEILVAGLTASLTAYLVHNLVNYDVVATGATFYLNVGLTQVMALVALRRKQAAQQADETTHMEPGIGAEGPDESGLAGRSSKAETAGKAAKVGRSAKGDKAGKVGRSAKGGKAGKVGRSGKGGKAGKVGRPERGAGPGGSELGEWWLPSVPSGVIGGLFLLSLVPLMIGSSGQLKTWLFVTPLAFFLGIVVSVLGRLRPRSLRSTQRRLMGLAGAFTGLWLAVGLPAVWFKPIHEGLIRDPFKWLWSLILLGPFLVVLFTEGVWRSDHKQEGEQAAGQAGNGQRSGGGENGSLLTSRSTSTVAALALLLVFALGSGSYGARHVYADWHLHRAKGISKTAVARIVRSGRRVVQALRSLAKLERSGRIDSSQAGSKRAALMAGLPKVQTVLKKLLADVRGHGTKAVSVYPMMGFFHHQYAKALQAFVKEPGLLPADLERKVLDEAVAESEKGTKNNTNPESANSNLAVLYYWSMRACGRDMTCRRRRLGQAKSALNRSISYDRYYYDTHRMKAFILMREGKLAEAVAELRLALEIISFRRDKYPTVLQVERSIDDTLLRRAYQAARSGNWQQAFDEAQQVVNRYGDPLPPAYLVMGRAAMRLKKYGEAEKQLTIAVEQMKPAHYPDAELDLARVLARRGRMDEALKLVTGLIEPKLREPQALLVRAWIYDRQGRTDKALADYQRFLRRKPRWPGADKIKAKIRALQGR